MTTKERMSNFELLRIIGMLLIIFHHLGVHGVWVSQSITSSNTVYFVKNFTAIFGNLGNWIFILISGWFISNSTFSWKRFFKQWFQIFSTSIIIGIILFLLKIPTICIGTTEFNNFGFAAASPMTIKDLIKSFLPTYLSSNWFIVAYMVFYLFTPYLNSYLKSLDKKTHFNLTILMFTLGIILGLFPKQFFFSMSNLFRFILGYFIANYIKLYSPKIFCSKKRNILIVFMLYTLFIIVYFSIFCLTKYFPLLYRFRNFFYKCLVTVYITISIIPAILLICYFRDLKIKNNKIINTFASTCLGIYLIHENTFFREVLWNKIVHINNFLNSPYLIP